MGRTTFGGRKRPGKKTIKPGGKVGGSSGGSSSGSRNIPVSGSGSGLSASQAASERAAQNTRFGISSSESVNYVPTTRKSDGSYSRGKAITPADFEKVGVPEMPQVVSPTGTVPSIEYTNAGIVSPEFTAGEGAGAGESAAVTNMNQLGAMLPEYLGIAAPDKGAYEDARASSLEDAGVRQAQEEVNRYQNKINQITAERDAAQLGLEGQGRGITDTIIGGQQARIGREAAIQAMPIQAQLAAASGNLEAAKEIMGQMYQARSADIQADQTYRTNLANSMMSFATTAQQTILQGINSDNAIKAQTAQANLAYQRQLGLQALEYGQQGLITGISNVDPSSPTFEQDMAAYTSQLMKPVAPSKLDTSFDKFGNLIDMQTGEVVRYANNLDGVNGGIEMPDGSFATADEIAYAQQYAATGQIPTGLSTAGVDFGRVSDLAKDMKKPDGALVNQFTGVTPTNVGDAQKAGIVAMSEIVNDTLPQLEKLWQEVQLTNFGGTGIVGGISSKIAPSEAMTRYKQARDEFLSKLLVARSGAAVTEPEYQRYSALVPDAFNSSFFLGSKGETKLDNLSSLMKSNLDNTLSTNQLTIYGYSEVELGDQRYKVGEVITNEYGQKGLIQPDGSITLVQ